MNQAPVLNSPPLPPTQVPFRLRVVALKPLPTNGSLKAFADVQISNEGIWLQINGCRLIQQAGQKAFVSLPQREYEVNGQKRYAAVIKGTREITDALLPVIEKALAASPRGFIEDER